jgi:hypothetical protein
MGDVSGEKAVFNVSFPEGRFQHAEDSDCGLPFAFVESIIFRQMFAIVLRIKA